MARSSGSGGGGGAVVLISKQVLAVAAANITFTGIPGTYNHLWVKGTLQSSVNAYSDTVLVGFNGDSGGNCDSTYAYTAGGDGWTISPIRAQPYAYSGLCAGNGGVGNIGSAYSFELPVYGATTFKKSWICTSGLYDGATSSSDQASGYCSGTWRSTAAVNQLVFVPSGGPNFEPGSALFLYGVN